MTVDIKKLFNYWLEEAGYSWEISQALSEKKKYPECLFFAHLTIEKILKALVVAATNQHSPAIHDLARLAQLTGLILTAEQKTILKEWGRFYLVGRYDEDKMEFRKICTKSYTQNYLPKIENMYLWLKEQAKNCRPR